MCIFNERRIWKERNDILRCDDLEKTNFAYRIFVLALNDAYTKISETTYIEKSLDSSCISFDSSDASHSNVSVSLYVDRRASIDRSIVYRGRHKEGKENIYIIKRQKKREKKNKINIPSLVRANEFRQFPI